MCAENIWNPATGNCENGKYVGSIVDNSVITCDEVIVQTKTVPTRHVMKNNISTNFNILFIFFLITIALLIAVGIYYCLIKYQGKQRPLLPCHCTISKLKETYY